MGNYFLHVDDGLEVSPKIEDVIPLNEVPVDCKSIVTELERSSTSQQEILDFDTIGIGSPYDVSMLEFYGSCSSTGSRVGVVLVSPNGNFFPFSFKLQFDNTNNIAKYESLLLGMNVA